MFYFVLFFFLFVLIVIDKFEFKESFFRDIKLFHFQICNLIFIILMWRYNIIFQIITDFRLIIFFITGNLFG